MHFDPIQRRRGNLSPILTALAPRTRPDTGNVLADQFVKDIEQRPRIERGALREEQCLGGRGGVDYHDGRVPKLDLIYGPIGQGPFPILFRGECP